MNDKIKQKLMDLPTSPGVYIMRSVNGQILYIGKARSLKNRVRQYFGSPKNKTTKVLIMVSKIDDFDYIITRNEIEALVLENNLIKKHKPPYNIMLKDDKSYPFIKINLKDKFPRIEVVRRLKKDGAKYFGPYMQGINTKDIIELIYSAFPLRNCKMNMDKVPLNHRPCLNYHIGRCKAPCKGYIDSEGYSEIISEVIKFLNGNDKSIEKILKKKMNAASENEDFELAIYYRDRLKSLDKLIRKQVTALPNDMDMDIFSIVSNGMQTVVAKLVVRGGKLLGGDKEIITGASLSLNTALTNYILGYYDKNPITSEILTNIDIEDKDLVTEYLSGMKGGKINIVTPLQGVRRQLLDMSENNARDFLEKSVAIAERKENMTIGGVLQLQEYLKLEAIPARMECYDISNISGTDKVSSMVVFTNGVPDKKAYRKFRIKTVEGANDFACMKETLLRRLERLKAGDTDFGARPDLIVVDGGKGQLGYALEAMYEVGVNIPIISLAEREEEIFIPNQSESIRLPRDSYALTMLQRLRDEAHRFAITYHKNLRGKRQTASELKDIEGVGDKTIQKLFAEFKSINKIRTASELELAEVKGINKNVAKSIYEYYNKKDEN